MTLVSPRVFSADAADRIRTEHLLQEIKESKNWALGIHSSLSHSQMMTVSMFASGLLGKLTQNLIVNLFGAKDRGSFLPFMFIASNIHHFIEHDSSKRKKITHELIRAGDHFAYSNCQELAQGLWTIAKTANAYAAHRNTVSYFIAGTFALAGLSSVINESWQSTIFAAGVWASIVYICYNGYANRMNDPSLEKIRQTVDVCLQQLETQQKQAVLPTAVRTS